MIEKVKNLLLGKTIENVEFSSSQATNDTLVLNFTDKTNIRIVSDPDFTFDGLAFYVKKSKTVEEEYYEEIK